MSIDYIEQYKILYKKKPNYGMKSIRFFDIIKNLINNSDIKNILDYGCGKSLLMNSLEEDLDINTYKYDPAISEYSNLPIQKIDLIICIDVLQHVPLYDLDRVLLELKQYNCKCFIHIRCTQYSTVLPNGEFANCTVYPYTWWVKKMGEYFKIINIVSNDEDNVTLIVK